MWTKFPLLIFLAFFAFLGISLMIGCDLFGIFVVACADDNDWFVLRKGKEPHHRLCVQMMANDWFMSDGMVRKEKTANGKVQA